MASTKPKAKKPVVPALSALSATLQREQQNPPLAGSPATTTPSKAAAAASPSAHKAAAAATPHRANPLPPMRSVPAAASSEKGGGGGGASSPTVDSAAPTQRSGRVTLAKAFLSARVSTMLSSRRRKSSLTSTPGDRSLEPPPPPHVWKLLPSQRAQLSHEYHRNHEAISTFWGIYSLVHECSISISPPLLEEALARVGVHVLSNGDLEGTIASEEQFLMVVEDIMCDDRHADVYFENDSKLVELALTSVDAASAGAVHSGLASGVSSPTAQNSPQQEVVHDGEFGTRMVNVAQLSAVLDRYRIGGAATSSRSQHQQQSAGAVKSPPPPSLAPLGSNKTAVDVANVPQGRAAKRTSLLTSPSAAFGETLTSNTWAPRAAADVAAPAKTTGNSVPRTAPFLEKVLTEFMSPYPHNGGVPPQRHSSVAPSTLMETPGKLPNHGPLSRRHNNDPAALRSDDDDEGGESNSRGALPAAIPLDFLCLALDRATLSTPDPLVDFRPVYRGANGGAGAAAACGGGGLDGASHISAGGNHRGSVWPRARSIAHTKKSLTQTQLPPIVPQSLPSATSAAAAGGATSPNAAALQPGTVIGAAPSSSSPAGHHRHSAYSTGQMSSSSPTVAGLRPPAFVHNAATVSSLLKRGDSIDNLVETALRECHHATANIIRRSTAFRLDDWGDDDDNAHNDQEDDDAVLAKAFDDEGHFILGNANTAATASSPHRRRHPLRNSGGRLDGSPLAGRNGPSPTPSPRNYARPWVTSPKSPKHGPLTDQIFAAEDSASAPEKMSNEDEKQHVSVVERHHRSALKESHRMSMKDLLEEVHQLSPAERRALTPNTRRLVALALRAEAAAATPQPTSSSSAAALRDGGTTTPTAGPTADRTRRLRRQEEEKSSPTPKTPDAPVDLYLSPTAKAQRQVRDDNAADSPSAAASPSTVLPSIRKSEHAQWERWTTGGRTALPPVPHGVMHGQTTKR